jgi:hypothetical protein
MGPFERVAGLSVVESLTTRVSPPDELEFSAVVLDMTAFALLVVFSGVQTLGRFDTPAQDLVAGQAALGGYPLVPLVTFETVAAPFETSVGLAQLSGGELGRERSAP